MAKISKTHIYNFDNYINLADYLLGTDGDNPSLLTKSYSIATLVGFINMLNGNSTIIYNFSIDETIHDTETGYVTTNASELDPSGITLLRINLIEVNGADLSTLLTSIKNNPGKILLKFIEDSDPNKVIVFKITSAVVDAEYVDFTVAEFGTVSTNSFTNNGTYSLIPLLINDEGVGGASGPTKLTGQDITAFINKNFSAASNIISVKLEKSTGAMVDLPIISKQNGGLEATINYSDTVSNVTIFIYTES